MNNKVKRIIISTFPTKPASITIVRGELKSENLNETRIIFHSYPKYGRKLTEYSADRIERLLGFGIGKENRTDLKDHETFLYPEGIIMSWREENAHWSDSFIM